MSIIYLTAARFKSFLTNGVSQLKHRFFRFKSLEADALQAQMVMTKEMMQQGRRPESVGGT